MAVGKDDSSMRSLHKCRFAILLSIGVLWLSACQKQKTVDHSDPFQDTHFKLVRTYQLPDTSLSAYVFDGVFDRAGDLYITDRYARRIKRVNRDFTQVTPIGHQGMGPGEYILPIHLWIANRQLFYSDRTTFIKSRPLQEEQDISGENLTIPVTRGASKFLVRDSLLVMLGAHSPYLTSYILGQNNKREKFKTGLTVPEFYDVVNRKILESGGLALGADGTMYVSLGTPYRIFVYGGSMQLLHTFDCEKYPGVIPWTKSKQTELGHLSSREEITNSLYSFTRVQSLHVITGKHRQYLLAELSDPGVGHRTVHLLSSGGAFIQSYQTTARILATRANRLYLTERPNAENDSTGAAIGVTHIREYQFRD